MKFRRAVLLYVLAFATLLPFVASQCCNIGDGAPGQMCITDPSGTCSSGFIWSPDTAPGCGTNDPCCNVMYGVVMPSTALCRASTGVCDPAEYCDGMNPTCPAQTNVAGQTCRSSVGGACDPAEVCDGVSPNCPADNNFCIGVSCSSGGCCNTATQQILSAGTQCRPRGDPVCDAQAEYCDGVSNLCPADTSSCIVGDSCFTNADCRDMLCPNPFYQADYVHDGQCTSGTCYYPFACTNAEIAYAEIECSWAAQTRGEIFPLTGEGACYTVACNANQVYNPNTGVCDCDTGNGYTTSFGGCVLQTCNAVHVGKIACDPARTGQTPGSWECQGSTCTAIAPSVCGASTVGQTCASLSGTNAGYYCSDGYNVDDGNPNNGRCCAAGQYYDSVSGACTATNQCNTNILTDYCGPSAQNFPTNLATFVSRNPQCIGAGATGAKPAGMAACCTIPGGKLGQSPYYDWTDRNGNLAGVVIY